MAKRLNLLTACFCTSALVLSGCGDNEPPQPYNLDLGDNQTRLLPIVTTVHFAHDERILSGNTQAEIVKPGEVASAASAGATAAGGGLVPVEVPVEPAGSLEEAVSNFGKAFARGLTSKGGAAQPGPGGAPQALSADDITAIHELVSKFNDTVSRRDISALADFHLRDQRSAMEQIYDRMADMANSVEALAKSLEIKEQGGDAKINKALDEFFAKKLAIEDAAPQSTGPDTATIGEVQFKRDGDRWYVAAAVEPTRDHVDQVMADYDRVEEALDDLTDEVLQGQAGADAAVSKLQKLLDSIKRS